MVGIEHIDKLSKELDLSSQEIIEVLRDEIALFYNVDWVLFTNKQTILLNKYDYQLKKIIQKTIFIQEKKFKTIIKNTTEKLYKMTKRSVVTTMKKRLNLKILIGKREGNTDKITLYEEGIPIKNLEGKLVLKRKLSPSENIKLESLFKYRLLGKTLHKKENKYVICCVPLFKKINQKEIKEKEIA